MFKLELEYVAGRTAAQTPEKTWNLDAEVLAEPRETVTARHKSQR